MRADLLGLMASGTDLLSPHVVEGARLLDEPAAQKKGYYGPPKA
jgi:formate dehydrogenase subunit delta